MADQDRASTEPTRGKVKPMPVTPSSETQRPDGLAFDVAKEADLSGVPVGDQLPGNAGAAGLTETGEGVGLAVPGSSDPEAGPPSARRPAATETASRGTDRSGGAETAREGKP
jgi:hypothetical protein